MSVTTDKISTQTHALRMAAWGCSAALLALPWVAMRFSQEVNWTTSDFVIFGAMLLTACLAFEVALRRVHSLGKRLMAAVGIAALFGLVWAQLAVGII